MTITVSLAVQLGGAAAHYNFEAKDVKQADEMARFLAGVAAAAPLPAIEAASKTSQAVLGVDKPLDKMTAKESDAYTDKIAAAMKEDAKAKKEQSAPATDTTQKSGQVSSEPESVKEVGVQYSYDQVKQLITDLVKDSKKEQAIALLQRFGMKVLAKDADADTYNQMGAMADGILAGTVDALESAEA